MRIRANLRPAWLAAILVMAATPALAAGPEAACPGRTPIGAHGASVGQVSGMPGNCTTAFGNDGTVDLNGRVTGYVYDTFNNITFAYDQQGRMVSQTYSNGLTVQMPPAGVPLTTVTDASGRTTRFTYDDQGSVTRVVDPLGATTRYTYDTGDRATSTIDTQGRTTTYTYDMGRMATLVDPEGATTTTMYDMMDRIAGSTRVDMMSNSYVTTYTYDPINRTVMMERPDTTGVTTMYDFMDRVIRETDTQGAGRTVEYFYDGASNRVTSMVDAMGMNPGLTTTYQYDMLNRMVLETDPLGATTTFTYDGSSNRILSVSESMGMTVTYQYDAYGRLAGLDMGQGNVYSYNYVPEPGTWALMLLGFGALGLAIRRRAPRPSCAGVVRA